MQFMSPGPFPIITVEKPKRDSKICIHHRKLSYPLPYVAETWDKMSGANILVVLIWLSGYHQIKVDQEISSIVASYRLFRFHRMTFELMDTPGTFQRVENILRSLDEVIFSHKTW